jgi:hypothetical protein
MKSFFASPLRHWAFRLALALFAVALTTGIGFLEGMAYANRSATIRAANNGAFNSWCALRLMKDPQQARLAEILDRELDSSGMKLAELTMSYPGLIERPNYDVLIQVRDYRKKYGRRGEKNSALNPAEVDRKIAEALAYLESIHNTNQWKPKE